jgi:hypothetical protein
MCHFHHGEGRTRCSQRAPDVESLSGENTVGRSPGVHVVGRY